MSRRRLGALVAILAFGCFWALRALLGGSDSASVVPQASPTQPAEAIDEQVIQLVEPRGLGGNLSPTRLLRNLYPSLWRADGYCWEEGTSDHDAANAQVDTGLTDGDEPPADLLALFAGRLRGYHDYEHRSFNSRRLLFLHQEMTATSAGREGPQASAVKIIRMERPDGRRFWAVDDSATVYPCD
ncbi:MAG: hypothetical protein OXH19_13175 [Chloroflexi bacterium]|nr:hypothetical protein [Chloroflexota bacterium]MCY3587945.1 hypothetical protein [Chloroflexota bacterium]MCY3684563.1 hypothetical protein [Chloroflexota bacterium]MDE2710101.1 hypothetical protein [Chloroflexota bacterium]